MKLDERHLAILEAVAYLWGLTEPEDGINDHLGFKRHDKRFFETVMPLEASNWHPLDWANARHRLQGYRKQLGEVGINPRKLPIVPGIGRRIILVRDNGWEVSYIFCSPILYTVKRLPGSRYSGRHNQTADPYWFVPFSVQSAFRLKALSEEWSFFVTEGAKKSIDWFTNPTVLE